MQYKLSSAELTNTKWQLVYAAQRFGENHRHITKNRQQKRKEMKTKWNKRKERRKRCTRTHAIHPCPKIPSNCLLRNKRDREKKCSKFPCFVSFHCLSLVLHFCLHSRPFSIKILIITLTASIRHTWTCFEFSRKKRERRTQSVLHTT